MDLSDRGQVVLHEHVLSQQGELCLIQAMSHGRTLPPGRVEWLPMQASSS